MRFNEKELKTLAAQHKCEKEGGLFFRERQEGFFRKLEGSQNFHFSKNFLPLPPSNSPIKQKTRQGLSGERLCLPKVINSYLNVGLKTNTTKLPTSVTRATLEETR